MKRFIYADNAATTKLDKAAFDSMIPWLTEEYGNASQFYSFSRNPKRALKEARETIANCINALPEEIYITSGGTESDNWAIKGCATFDSNRREVITSAIEHHAVINSCNSLTSHGFQVVYLQPEKDGLIPIGSLEKTISHQTRLVSIMFSNNEIGTIEPIKDLVKIAHEHGALFHTDAVQAVGHVPIDVNELGVDMLSASAHKFNGPKGVGFLYIKRGTPLKVLLDGGEQESGMRAGTENVAGIVGMASAIKNNCEQIEVNGRHLLRLEEELMKRIEGLDFIRNGAKNHVPGNVSLSFRDADGEAILHRLDLKGICVSTGSACDSVNTQLSHVIKAINVPKEYALGTIRISLGKNNTIEDVEQIASALWQILKK